jgi:hypothetical protein
VDGVPAQGAAATGHHCRPSHRYLLSGESGCVRHCQPQPVQTYRVSRDTKTGGGAAQAAPAAGWPAGCGCGAVAGASAGSGSVRWATASRIRCLSTTTLTTPMTSHHTSAPMPGSGTQSHSPCSALEVR